MTDNARSHEGAIQMVDTTMGPTVQVIVTRSAGKDGAVLVFIDTYNFEPDGSDGGPGLRVLLNDGDLYTEVPFEERDDGLMHQFTDQTLTVEVESLIDTGLVD